MASIVVEFEVEDAGDTSERSAQQVCQDLQQQLRDPSSRLRTSESFRRFAEHATLSAPGLGDTGIEDEAAPPPPSRGSEAFPGGSGGGPFSAPQPFSQGGFDAPAQPPQGAGFGAGADWQGLSDAQLLERMSSRERQVHRTAIGGRQDVPSVRDAPIRRAGAHGDEALEEKCMHLQQRLEVVERELRETTEAYRTYRQRFDQVELKLKDREQLLAHAKEMWMKENVRASRLADALTTAEDKLADQERRLAEVSERYNEAQQEVRALQHLLGANGEGFADRYLAEKKTNGRLPATIADLPSAAAAPRTMSTSHSFESSFGRDIQPGTARALPSTAPGLRDDLRIPPSMPLDAETNTDRFRRLCLINDAVLYEDELLQVGLKAEYNGMEGQLAVFFGNKGKAALHAFTVQYFVKEEQALRLSASPLCQQLDADRQVVQRVGLTCQEPFAEPPWLRIQFLLPDTSPRRIQMKLPVVLTKFMVGRELTPQEFFQRWREQQFVLNEATSIVHLAARLRGALVHVARSIVFGGALRLHQGIDSNPDNFVLVGQLTETTKGPGGDFDVDRSRDLFGLAGDRDRGLSLVRLEVGSGRFTGKVRIVVRSSHHTVARALCDGLVAQLSEPNAPPSDGAVAR